MTSSQNETWKNYLKTHQENPDEPALFQFDQNVERSLLQEEISTFGRILEASINDDKNAAFILKDLMHLKNFFQSIEKRVYKSTRPAIKKEIREMLGGYAAAHAEQAPKIPLTALRQEIFELTLEIGIDKKAARLPRSPGLAKINVFLAQNQIETGNYDGFLNRATLFVNKFDTNEDIYNAFEKKLANSSAMNKTEKENLVQAITGYRDAVRKPYKAEFQDLLDALKKNKPYTATRQALPKKEASVNATAPKADNPKINALNKHLHDGGKKGRINQETDNPDFDISTRNRVSFYTPNK